MHWLWTHCLVAAAGTAGAGAGMSPELKRSVDEFIAKNKVVVFMKGNKEAPQVRGGEDARGL